MSYSDIAAMVEDWDLRLRLMACASQEQHDDPGKFLDEHVWRICSQPGWDAAWASALASHADDPEYHPGADNAVITDGMILSGTQAVISDVSAHEAQVAKATLAVSTTKTVTAQQLEADANFEMYVRQREWDLAHMPQYSSTPPPPLLPTESDDE
jgi:hypothetical protein